MSVYGPTLTDVHKNDNNMIITCGEDKYVCTCAHGKLTDMSMNEIT